VTFGDEPITNRNPRPPITIQPRYVPEPAEPLTLGEQAVEHDRLREGERVWGLVKSFAEATNQSSPMPGPEPGMAEPPVEEKLGHVDAYLSMREFLDRLEEMQDKVEAVMAVDGWVDLPAPDSSSALDYAKEAAVWGMYGGGDDVGC